MLQNVVTTKVRQIEAAGEREFGAGPDGLGVEEKRIGVLDVEPAQHAVFEGLEVDVFAVARKVAVIGQGVQPRAGSAGFVK